MPTGYTATLHDGHQDFDDFVLSCARAFGALIHMRDSSSDSKITLDKVSEYYGKALEEAYAKKRKYDAFTQEDWEQKTQSDYREQLDSYYASKAKSESMEARYRNMIERVEKWGPPSEDHVGLKEFMISQLKESISFDCSSDFLEKYMKPKVKTWEEVKEETLSKVNRDIEYYTEEQKKETERVEGRNRWILQLIESLGLDPKDVLA